MAAGGAKPTNTVATEAGTPAAPERTTSVPTTEAPGPQPEPDAQYTSSCDYVLGDFTDNTATGYRFVAGADITNTGNVGIKVRVRARWKQLGTDPIVETRDVEVGYNRSKSVQITVQVSNNEISLIQSAQESGEICTVVATITGTVGDPQ